MTTVGFGFTKISAERKIVSEQNIRIENNIGIVGISESEVLDPKKSLIKFEFTFICKYEPGLGVIELKGELVEMYDKDLSAKILEHWAKDKKVHPDIMTNILNNVLARANMEAIFMSRELGLPSPIQMPKVEVKSHIDVKPSGPPIITEIKKEDTKKDETKAKKK